MAKPNARHARGLRWLVACVAASAVLALVLALSFGVAARAVGDGEGDDVEVADVSQEGSGGGGPSSELGDAGDDASGSAEANGSGGDPDAGDGTGSEDDASADGTTTDDGTAGESSSDASAAAKPRRAPASDSWHDEYGLPTYGVRIVLDDSSESFNSSNSDSTCLGLDVRVRAKDGATPTNGVVLEKYRWNGTGYILLATRHITVPTNNWGSENSDTDDQCVWYWPGGFNNKVWTSGSSGYYIDGSSWYQEGGAFDFDQKSTSWQRLALFFHAAGSTSYTAGVGLSDGSAGGSVGNDGYFSSVSDVYVLRAADTGTGAVVAPQASDSYEYQIQNTIYGDYSARFGANTTATTSTNPQDLTTSDFTDISTGGLDTFTGVRTLPTSGVETISITSKYRWGQGPTQSNISSNPANTLTVGDDGVVRDSNGNAANVVIIRNNVEGDSSSYGTMATSVTLMASEDNYNYTSGWGNPNYQLNVHAFVYTFDPVTNTYTYKQQVGGDRGIHLGSTNAFTEGNLTLAPNEAVVLQPRNTRYAFTYRVEVNPRYTIDSVKDAGHGTLTELLSVNKRYDSGLVASFTDSAYATTVSAKPNEEIVLTTSLASSATPVISSGTFTQLTNDNIGTGREIRPLKVNLFDYDIPDDWHYTTGDDNSQGDVTFRFVSDSDGSTNLQDPAVNLVSQLVRTRPYQGILQDTLDANGLPVFSTGYTTPFSNLGGLFSLTPGTQDAGTAYKWAVTTAGTAENNTPATTTGDVVRQLAHPDSPITWYNDYTGGGEKTYENVRTKDVFADVDFDFVYDTSTEYYSYYSQSNHAQLTDDGKAVHQYDHALGMGGSINKWGYKEGWGENSYEGQNNNGVADTNGQRAAGFFPFDHWESAVSGSGSGYGQNRYGKSYAFKPGWSSDGTTLLRKEEDLDYHFGMSTTQRFAIPEGGKVHDADMIFSFTGDDDFWLFVDGKLVLDIGGIHEAASGQVNFTQGTYTVDGTTHQLSSIFSGYDAQYPTESNDGGSGAWAAGTVHTFSVFYLERGGTFSNLGIRFNTPIVSASAEKVWDDDGAPEGQRTDATVYLESTEGTVTDQSVWTKVEGSERTFDKEGAVTQVGWSNLPMLRYDSASSSNIPIHYRLRESSSSSYSSRIEVRTSSAQTWAEGSQFDADGAQLRVTNTYEYTYVRATKTWDDGNDADHLRPESVTVEVKNGDDVVETLTLDADNGWSATSGKLPKYDADGNEIAYTTSEVAVDGYTTTSSETAGVFYTVSRTWADAEGAPASVTAEVRNGDDVVATLALDADDAWTATTTDLPRYDDNGDEIAYTVASTGAPEGFEGVSAQATTVRSFALTNSHVSGRTLPLTGGAGLGVGIALGVALLGAGALRARRALRDDEGKGGEAR